VHKIVPDGHNHFVDSVRRNLRSHLVDRIENAVDGNIHIPIRAGFRIPSVHTNMGVVQAPRQHLPILPRIRQRFQARLWQGLLLMKELNEQVLQLLADYPL
jgi:hypothetical protein